MVLLFSFRAWLCTIKVTGLFSRDLNVTCFTISFKLAVNVGQ